MVGEIVVLRADRKQAFAGAVGAALEELPDGGFVVELPGFGTVVRRAADLQAVGEDGLDGLEPADPAEWGKAMRMEIMQRLMLAALERGRDAAAEEFADMIAKEEQDANRADCTP